MAHVRSFPVLKVQTNVTRITLQADEVLSLHLGGQTVQVIGGVAWITQDNEDLLMTTGCTTTFRTSRFPAVISAMRHQPVTLITS